MNKQIAVSIGESFGSPFGASKGLGDLVTLILNISFTISGILILFFFVFGGIQMIQGAGKNNPESVAKGKQAVTAAVIGFAIVFVAFWIIRVLELITGVNFITAPSF
jgi:hypothetical protein